MRMALNRTNHRLAELQRTCDELGDQLQARDLTIAELQSQFTSRGTNPGMPLVAPTGTAAVAVTEAELQRRMAEVSALQARAAEMVAALAAMREAPEATEIPEHADRARVSVQVYEKHLEEARAKATTLATQTKDLLVSLNVPRDIAHMDAAKALASVDLQPYWPYFEARREVEAQNDIVERIRIRMLQETIEAEILEAQRKAISK
jgi:hypothetical protein